MSFDPGAQEIVIDEHVEASTPTAAAISTSVPSSNSYYPFLNTFGEVRYAVSNLSTDEAMRCISLSFPKEIIQEACRNREYHVMLHALLKLEATTPAAIIFSKGGKKLINSARTLTTKNVRPPLKNWFDRYRCSYLITLLAVLSQGSEFISKLLKLSPWDCEETESDYLKRTEKKDKSILMQREENSGTKKNKNWRSEFRFMDADGNKAKFKDGFVVLLISYMKKRYPQKAEVISAAVSDVREALKVAKAAPSSEQRLTDMDHTEGGEAVQKILADIRNGKFTSTTTGMDQPLGGGDDDSQGQVHAGGAESEAFLAFVQAQIEKMAAMENSSMNQNQVFSNGLPRYLESFSLYNSVDSTETLVKDVKAVKGIVGGARGLLETRGKHWATFYFGVVGGMAINATIDYNVVLNQVVVKGVSQASIKKETNEKYVSSAAVLIAFLLHTDNNLKSLLPNLPSDIVDCGHSSAEIFLALHYAVLGVSAHRDGQAQQRMEAFLRIALATVGKDGLTLDPVDDKKAGSIASSIMWAMKQAWRCEKVRQTQPSGHQGGECEGKMRHLTMTEQLIWDGNMHKASAMIILFTLRSMAGRSSKSKPCLSTQFRRGSRERCVLVGDGVVSFDTVRDVSLELNKELTDKLVALLVGDLTDALLLEDENRDLRVLEGVIRGQYYISLVKGGSDREVPGFNVSVKRGEGEVEVVTANRLRDIFVKRLKRLEKKQQDDFLYQYCKFTGNLYVLTTLLTCSRAGSELAGITFRRMQGCDPSDLYYLQSRSSCNAMPKLLIDRHNGKWGQGSESAAGIVGACPSLLICVSCFFRDGIMEAFSDNEKVSTATFKSKVFLGTGGGELTQSGKLFRNKLQSVIENKKLSGVSFSVNELRHAMCLLETKIMAKMGQGDSDIINAYSRLINITTSHSSATHKNNYVNSNIDYGNNCISINTIDLEILQVLAEFMFDSIGSGTRVNEQCGGEEGDDENGPVMPWGSQVDAENSTTIGERLGEWEEAEGKGLSDLTKDQFIKRRDKITNAFQGKWKWLISVAVLGYKPADKKDQVEWFPEVLRTVVETMMIQMVREENLGEKAWSHVHKEVLLFLPCSFGKTAAFTVIALFKQHIMQGKPYFDVIVFPSVTNRDAMAVVLRKANVIVVKAGGDDGMDPSAAASKLHNAGAGVLMVIADTLATGANAYRWKTMLLQWFKLGWLHHIVWEEAQTYAEQAALRFTTFHAIHQMINNEGAHIPKVIVSGSATKNVQEWISHEFFSLKEGITVVGGDVAGGDGVGGDEVGGDEVGDGEGNATPLPPLLVRPSDKNYVTAPTTKFSIGGPRVLANKQEAADNAAKTIVNAVQRKERVLIGVMELSNVDTIMKIVSVLMPKEVQYIFNHANAVSSEKQRFLSWVGGTLPGVLVAFVTQTCAGMDPYEVSGGMGIMDSC